MGMVKAVGIEIGCAVNEFVRDRSMSLDGFIQNAVKAVRHELRHCSMTDNLSEEEIENHIENCVEDWAADDEMLAIFTDWQAWSVCSRLRFWELVEYVH